MQHFLAAAAADHHELDTFWLRKTRKPVLAVLMVSKPGEPHRFYRGLNMEVSMPTGSLCAERNVIGTALASDPSITRQHLTMVAVYAANLPTPAEGRALGTSVAPSVTSLAVTPTGTPPREASYLSHAESPGTRLRQAGGQLGAWMAQARAPAPTKGRNPINPCGACNEWLRKVADCNPDFKVVTFTDSSMEQVYVKPVEA